MTSSVLSLSRKQLAQFLPTQEAIRAFESLFNAVSTLDPQTYNSVVSQLDSLTTQVYNLNITVDSLQTSVTSLSSEIVTLTNKIDDIEKSYYERGTR